MMPAFRLPSPPDFRYAAKKATPCVVYTKSQYQPSRKEKDQNKVEDFHVIPDPFRDFFEEDPFLSNLNSGKRLIRPY